MALLIALPIFVLSALGTLFQSLRLSQAEQATYSLGRAAAVIRTDHPVPAKPGVVAEQQRGVTLTVRESERVRVDLRDLPLRMPLLEGIVALTSGTAPGSADEVVISEGLRDRMHLGVGDVVALGGRHDLRIVGTCRVNSSTEGLWVFAAPGQAAAFGGSFLEYRQYVTDQELAEIRRSSVDGSTEGLLTRDAAGGHRPSLLTPVSVIAGALLFLLSGLLSSATTIGAYRRQLCDSAVLSSCGATTHQITTRQTYGTLLVWLPSSIAGVAGGITLGALAIKPASSQVGYAVSGTAVPWTLVSPTLAASLLASALASYAPLISLRHLGIARSATLSPRPRESAASRRVSILCLSLAVLTSFYASAHRGRWLVVVTTFLLLTATLVMLPSTLRRLGSIASRASLGWRLTVRELARDARLATAIIATTLVATAFAVLAMDLLSADMRRQERSYQPRLPPHQAILYSERGGLVREADARQAARLLGGTDVAAIRVAGSAPPDDSDATSNPGAMIIATAPSRTPSAVASTAVATRELLFTAGVPDSIGEAVLAGTGIVVTDARLAKDGRSLVSVIKEGHLAFKVLLPAHVVAQPESALGTQAFIPQWVVRRARVETRVSGYLMRVDAEPSGERIESARTFLSTSSDGGVLEVEQGYQRYASRYLLFLTAGATLLAVGASCLLALMTTASLQGYLRALRATGADPRLLTTLAARVAGLASLVGSVVGAAIGTVIAFAMSRAALNAPFAAAPGLTATLIIATVVGSVIFALASNRGGAGERPAPLA